MTTVTVWPRLMDDGTSAVVRMPERGMALLPVEGAPVPEASAYWQRRLRDRDVVLSDPRPVSDEPAPAEAEGEVPPTDPVPAV